MIEGPDDSRGLARERPRRRRAGAGLPDLRAALEGLARAAGRAARGGLERRRRVRRVRPARRRAAAGAMTTPAPPARRSLDLARAIRAGDTYVRGRSPKRCLAAHSRARPVDQRVHHRARRRRARRGAHRRPRAGGRAATAGRCTAFRFSIKDILDVAGLPTTAASHVRREHVAARDATVVARLREAGAVFVGKTNLHEFALGTTNEESAYGPVHHPLDPTRSPGGSSGGSAASVLAGHGRTPRSAPTPAARFAFRRPRAGWWG